MAMVVLFVREAALRQTPDGRLANFGEPGTATEGQAFCLLMEAARQTMSSA